MYMSSNQVAKTDVNNGIQHCLGFKTDVNTKYNNRYCYKPDVKGIICKILTKETDVFKVSYIGCTNKCDVLQYL